MTIHSRFIFYSTKWIKGMKLDDTKMIWHSVKFYRIHSKIVPMETNEMVLQNHGWYSADVILIR